jgi:hypothetical protein
MAIGFIPRDQDDEENDAIKEELHTLKEMWDARQLAEALVADQMLKDAHEVLFQQVRRYADQLEILDPETHNAAQEVSKVVLVLSYAETAQERLNALTNEAGRLMLAVAEVKRQRGEPETLEVTRTAVCSPLLWHKAFWAFKKFRTGTSLCVMLSKARRPTVMLQDSR